MLGPGKYIDLHLRKNCFYIIDLHFETEALAVLKKIEYVINKKLAYDQSQQDEYSKLPIDTLQKLLGNFANNIYRQYNTNCIFILRFTQNFFFQGPAEKKCHINIQNLINPPSLFPLPNELTQEILSYLRISELFNFAKVNRHAQEHAKYAIMYKMRPFTCPDKSFLKISLCLKNIYLNISELAKYAFIPPKYVFFKIGKIDFETTIKNLKFIKTNELFNLLALGSLYTDDYSCFRKLLNKDFLLEVTKTSCPEVKEKGGQALLLATIYGEEEIASLLLENGANPNHFDLKGITPLQYAASNGYNEIIKLLISFGANVNHQSNRGCTALMFACGFGNYNFKAPKLEAIKILLQNNANPNLRNNDERSPLFHAVKCGYLETVKLLINHGAKIDELSMGNNTPLAFACEFADGRQSNHLIVKLLLKKKANPNLLNINGKSPLHHAVSKGSIESAALLLKYKAYVDQKDNRSCTPLFHACGIGYFSSVGLSPQPKMVKLLLKNGANPNLSDPQGSYPLHHAAQRGYLKVVKTLLNNGASVNLKSQGFNTPLVFACGYGDPRYLDLNDKVVKLLLDNKADPTIISSEGLTPLQHAQQKKLTPVVTVLKAHALVIDNQVSEKSNLLNFSSLKIRDFHQ